MNNWRTETRGNIRFHLVDNMELMNSRPDKYWDLAICDPPYGLDLANMNMGIGNTPKASKAKNRKWKAKDWDKITPTLGFFKQLFNVSENQIIWGGNYFDLPVCKKFIIWDKEVPAGLSFSDCEYAWTSFSGANKMFRYSAYKDKAGKFHPTQKPVALYRWLLQRYAKEGDRILDTHGGSFTHAIACDMEGFELDICETDEEYFNNGLAAFDKYKAQTCIEFPTQDEGIQLTI